MRVRGLLNWKRNSLLTQKNAPSLISMTLLHDYITLIYALLLSFGKNCNLLRCKKLMQKIVWNSKYVFVNT